MWIGWMKLDFLGQDQKGQGSYWEVDSVIRKKRGAIQVIRTALP